MKAEINLSLSFSQILNLVRSLPRKQKIKLTRELEREAIESKLTALINAFKTDDLTDEIINKEVDLVRQQLYEKSKKH